MEAVPSQDDCTLSAADTMQIVDTLMYVRSVCVCVYWCVCVWWWWWWWGGGADGRHACPPVRACVRSFDGAVEVVHRDSDDEVRRVCACCW